MTLPLALSGRLKPGLMVRPGTRAQSWDLYEPASDLTCTLALEPTGNELGPSDLHNHDRAWNDGRLQLDLYHQAQRLRRHVDGQEVNFEINYLCRFACRHCFQQLEPASDPGATPAGSDLFAAAARLLEAGPSEISITGGDIFLQPALWELLDYFHQRSPQCTLRLLVNGGGLDLDDPATRERLAGLAGRRVLIKSDFFGSTPELHDGFTRVPGSFAHLVRIVEFLREAGLACLPAAALTRANFETRFELVNFLYHLSGDSYTVSSIVYPSERRLADALAELRLTPEQYGELLVERFFAPLAAEYHTFEPQCGGDCQFAVVSASGDAWGCSFLKVAPGRLSLPLVETVQGWRAEAVSRAVYSECPTCPARSTCRRCPSFIAAGQMGDSYCALSRLAYPHVQRRATLAREAGYAFVEEQAGLRLLGETVA